MSVGARPNPLEESVDGKRHPGGYRREHRRVCPSGFAVGPDQRLAKQSDGSENGSRPVPNAASQNIGINR